jgi:hypothetical protein
MNTYLIFGITTDCGSTLNFEFVSKKDADSRIVTCIRAYGRGLDW